MSFVYPYFRHVNSILEIQGVSKWYEDKQALFDIHLSVPKGSIYGILGPNGAGKTTLIRMVTTITKPDTGQILFKGNLLNEDDARFMGYMPEERGLYRKMKVAEQLLFFAELKGLKGKIAKEEAKYWMNRFDITSWANKKVEELSKGMAQKVQFITTIMHKPELVILDEPFSGFDPVNADLIKDMILELNKNGATILFSTHRMDNVDELCDYLSIIHLGKKVLDGKVEEIRKQFFNHEYLIATEQKMIWDQSIPIEYLGEIELGYHQYKFTLSNHQKPDTILSQALAQGGLKSFQELIPSIHEIFVKTVKETPHA